MPENPKRHSGPDEPAPDGNQGRTPGRPTWLPGEPDPDGFQRTGRSDTAGVTALEHGAVG